MYSISSLLGVLSENREKERLREAIFFAQRGNNANTYLFEDT